jgi:DNA-binding NarL/FixJ family response regulator
MTLKVLIADDEPLVRKSVRRFLQTYDVEVINECSDGRSCVDAIRDIAPDLIFLDLQMPELDGRQVIAEIRERMPPTVILTAHNDYAVEAYDANVIDYVLRPWRGPSRGFGLSVPVSTPVSGRLSRDSMSLSTGFGNPSNGRNGLPCR